MMKVTMKLWQLLVDAHCPPRKVLIIDDDDALRETLKEQFTLHDEFEITDAATASAGLKGSHLPPPPASIVGKVPIP